MFCARLFICASWSPAGKGLTSWLSFVVSYVSLSLSHWYPGSGVVLDCIDSWSLQPYLLVVTCLERAVLLCVVFSCVTITFPFVYWSTSELRVRLVPFRCLSPPVSFYWPYKEALLLWIVFVIYVPCFFCYVVLSILWSLVITCWERTDFLALW